MESAEHAWIGDQIELHFDAGIRSAKGLPLYTGGATSLTYGQLIALGGDFYGVVGQPISTAKEPSSAFVDAWHSIVSPAAGELGKILAVMDKEIAVLAEAKEKNREPSTAYEKLGDTLSGEWNRITGGGTRVYAMYPMGRYLSLAAENWDHFTHFAVAAYQAGHDVAMSKASTIQLEFHEDQWTVALQEAYAMNAFADHFLTDLFSAGHLRAPRKELYDGITLPIPGAGANLGSLLVRCMHDEDSFNGLNVTNANKNSWVAYGDKRLLDSVSAANAEMVKRAVQASADDVWRVYQGGAFERRALQLIPDLAAVADVSAGVADPKKATNFSPLFRVQDGVVACRNDLSNREDFSWTTNWFGWTTFLALMGNHNYLHARCIDLATNQPVGWLGSDQYGSTRLAREEKDAHGVMWHFEGDKLYLQKDTKGGDRYLGLGTRNYATWGHGWSNPVIFNDDRTISLEEWPGRKLFLDNDDWLSWTHGPDSEYTTILVVDLPLRVPSIPG